MSTAEWQNIAGFKKIFKKYQLCSDTYSKLLPGKNTQKVNKQKFVFRKIGCSHEVNEIILTEQNGCMRIGRVKKICMCSIILYET
jgi:hypothetical protein